MPQVLPVIGAVSTVAGTVLSYTSQQKASKEAKKQQNLATMRSNRQAIREAQLRRAQAISAASALGAEGGSALSGGLGSLSSQLGSGLAFSNQMTSLSNNIEKYRGRAQLFGDVAGLGAMAFKAGGGWGGLNSFWSGNTTGQSSSGMTRPQPNPFY